jgi:hypothetical protein
LDRDFSEILPVLVTGPRSDPLLYDIPPPPALRERQSEREGGGGRESERERERERVYEERYSRTYTHVHAHARAHTHTHTRREGGREINRSERVRETEGGGRAGEERNLPRVHRVRTCTRQCTDSN